jgi:UDP:flavonoid glycosyltransferase YjiC (YdhE family)
VFTHRRFEAQVTSAGGRFVDLFAHGTLEEADDESLPVPSRHVTFAGVHAEAIIRDVTALRPALILYDGFAVIGRVVASAFGLPYVNVCAGHAVTAVRYRALLTTDPRVRTSARCLRTVETLRERYGVHDASPFSYVSEPSPYLNVYCEPPEYLTDAERRAFEPVLFFGSLPPIEELDAGDRPDDRETPSPFGGGASGLKIYASFGTVVWRYWAREALAALGVIADAVAAMPEARGVLSLGRAPVAPADVRALVRPNVSVASYVDQWAVLREADVFVTHHGLNSTHEAIFAGVPMISYPFFWDQPSLAAKCQDLGLAIALVETARDPLRAGDVTAALAELDRRRPAIVGQLAQARAWERRTLAGREEVLQHIVDLSRRT